GMVDAGFENQKELTKMQLDNQKEIAEMQNETQKEIAGIQSATSRQNTKDQIGRASCRERVQITAGGASLKKKRASQIRRWYSPPRETAAARPPTTAHPDIPPHPCPGAPAPRAPRSTT